MSPHFFVTPATTPYLVELQSGHLIRTRLVTDNMPEIHTVLMLPTTIAVPEPLWGAAAAQCGPVALETFLPDDGKGRLFEWLREQRRERRIRR